MAYAEEIRVARDKSQFGKGNPVGVIASEMGNNACAMGDLIPTLSLGIPGSVGAAVFLGIMIIFGVIPGHRVFIDQGKTIYGLFTAFFIESLLILGLGFGTGGLGVALSGWIADGIGLYRTIWIMALVPVVCSLLAVFIKTPRRANEE